MLLMLGLLRNALLWTVLYLSFAGIGSGIRRACGRRIKSASDWLGSFWLGFATVLVFLQLWHLAFPVSPLCLAFAVVAGAIGSMANRVEIQRLLCDRHAPVLALAWAVAALVLAFAGAQSVQNYDTGLYHMAAVKWASSYPIVRGLGNLYERLAFNSSHFLYAAMLDVGPWREGSQHVAGGLLVLALCVDVALGMGMVLKARGQRLATLFPVAVAAPLMTAAFGRNISSLSPDLVVFVLGLVMTTRLVMLLDGASQDGRDRRFALAEMAAIGFAGITVKLSFAVLAGMTVLVALLGCLRQDRRRGGLAADIAVTIGIGVALLIPWLWRGIVLSGYPLFPATVAGADVPWRVPFPLAESTKLWIMSWARYSGAPWPHVLGNWNWFPGWLQRLPAGVWIPVAISMACLSTLVLRRRSVPWLVLAPTAASLGYWFAAAPDPRFAGASFWIVACVLFSACIAEFAGARRHARIRHGFLLLLVLSAFIAVRPTVFAGGPRAMAELPTVHYRQVTTDSGLAVFVPEGTDQCWNLPLPCSPYFRRNLCLLRAGRVDSGFFLDDSVTYADGQGVPAGFRVSRDLGVSVIGSGWSAHVEEHDARRIRSPAELVLYCAKPGVVRVRFLPQAIESAGKRLNSAWLDIEIDGMRKRGKRVQVGEPISMDVRIPGGFCRLGFLISLPVTGLSEGKGSAVEMVIQKVEVRTSTKHQDPG